MGKDPAMLWYWADWHSGTSLMSRHQKGCYMDLLHAQFNNGPLSIEDIKTVLGGDFGPSWPTLSKKFKQTADGRFFNERLESEKRKRAEYSRSRASNRSGKKSKTHETSYDNHMIGHMENENRNENTIGFKIKKGVKIFGDDETQPSVVIPPKYAGELPIRVYGTIGVREYLEFNSSTTHHSDDYIAKFLEARNGSFFDDGISHFVNALNKFKAETPKLVDLKDL